MNQLYRVIKLNYYKKYIINKHERSSDLTEINNIVNLQNLSDNNSYIGKEFIKLKRHYVYSIKIQQINININIYTYDNDEEEINKKIIDRIFTMIESFYDRINIKEIVFYILLFDAPRVITKEYENTPKEFEIFSKLSLFNCINGWFKKYENCYEIVVTRKNNCLGLLTHELCHLCQLDYGGYITFHQWYSYHLKNISNNPGKFTEGINNAISTIIHSLFLNLEHNNNYNYLYAEIKHSYKLCQKIIKYFKCSSLNELLNKKIYNQTSQIFEYMFLRYIYLKNLDILFHLKYDKINNIFYNKTDMNKYYNTYIILLENENYNIVNNNDNNNIEYMEYYKHE